MKLQTQIPLQKVNNQIDYQSRIMLLGSCFVENIGEKLKYYKFRSWQNPFGILFHPKAIETLVLRSVNDKRYAEEDVFYHNERWHCFDAHSSLSDASKEGLLQNLNNGLEVTRESLSKSTHIVLTLGTAWVYRNNRSNTVVANCHKVPQKEFAKALLSVTEVVESLGNTMEVIKSVNPNAQFILTVSPVRHIKDGFVENQRSKAHLITAIHQIIDKNVVPGTIQGYFPSYEIMLDELRDYRFYETDMLHPNKQAIDYIWEKFKQVWILEESYQNMDQVDTIQRGLLHRPFNPNSEQHRTFLNSLQDKIKTLQNSYPFMDF
ncbi:GSCFA domain-containing protein [Maribacter sp. 2304DJ31-5]|uniref:GSCFA domain-containing protein n=1 Tax=Maribacter sp. 2304DJ31-5 TaxID=3386273 RepID=UPI0039BC3B47